MHADPATPIFVITILAIISIGFVMKKLKQPHVVGYLLAGILLGPNLLNIVKEPTSLARIGAVGVIFLLFFVGMEVSPKRLLENWVISVVGTLVQVIVSVLVIALIGLYLHWPLPEILLGGFVISLSSTAVVIKLLSDWHELNTRVGQHVVGILLIQDLVMVPMIILLNVSSGHHMSLHTITLQILGGILIFALAIFLTMKEHIHIPFLKKLAHDHESQVFLALMLCFGFAMITGALQLSAALGAFMAGMFVASAKETDWVRKNLLPLRTIFMAFFFVSVGMVISFQFIWEYCWEIIFFVIAALMTNTIINAITLKILGENWRTSLYAGSLLSQIGEFSFVLALVGYQLDILNKKGYQLTITVIALTLLFSPLWIVTMKKIIHKSNLSLSRLPADSDK